MSTLDRRVQVLFDAEEYSLLQAMGRRERLSVGAIIRQSVRRTLHNPASQREEALRRLLERADATSVGDWEDAKDGFERDSLAAIA